MSSGDGREAFTSTELPRSGPSRTLSRNVGATLTAAAVAYVAATAVDRASLFSSSAPLTPRVYQDRARPRPWPSWREKTTRPMLD